MKKILFMLLFASCSFTSCQKSIDELLNGSSLSGAHSYTGGETKIKVGSWSTETVGNGKIQIDLDKGSFILTAGSQNTKTDLEISFDTLFIDEAPKTYSFETVNAYAIGDYWKETNSSIDWYSHEWGTGLVGNLSITTLTKDLIEGEFEFIGIEQVTDFKQRKISGSFSLPKE